MKKKLKFIVPSLFVIAILSIIFCYHELYPFGGNSIVQVDADYQFIPVLYRIFDFLHGNGSIIYDDIGNGNNIYISMIIQGSIFSPTTLLLYFTSRSNIINFFNIIVIVKLCLISLTTYIYINKTFKVKEYYKIVFSILYTFSGWVILNYFNIMWLDSLILFPLIVMYLNELLCKEKYLGYIVTLSLSLIISYYISYFILLFIIFYSFLYIFLKLDKENAKQIIFKLGISTVIAALISSFSVLPALYQTFISSRIDSNYMSGLFDNFINKSLFLMFSTVFLVIFGKLIFKYKKDKKNVYFYLILSILFGIGMFIEPINLGIHLGSYWSFPYRYSFVTLFILMSGCLYYLEKYNFKGYNKYQLIRFVIFVLFGIILCYLNNKYYDIIVDSQLVLDFDNVDVYKKILIIFSIMIVMILLTFSFSNKKLRYISFSLICLLQIFIYSSWTMYYSEGYFLTKNSNMINNNINIDNDLLGRYKMGYTNYTPDYGFIYKVNTLDNWLHILPSNEVYVYDKLGYRTTGTCVRSYGGTIFTDWLFNVKYFLDNKANSNNIYTLLDKYEEYSLYKYNYSNGFGVIYNKVDDNSYYNYLSTFELNNMMYRELFNKDDDIIDFDYYSYNDVYNISLNYEIDDKGFLYIELVNDVSYIRINNNYIDFDDYGYVIDLGLYEDDVKIDIGLRDMNYLGFYLGFIKYDDIMNLSSNVSKVEKINNGYNIKVFNDFENGHLFLPINNIDGLKVFVNNKVVKVDSYMNNFVSIKLNNGDNKIEVRYDMPLFKIGIALSILGIVCLILFKKIPSNNIILNIVYYVYILFCLTFYLYYYGYSLIKYYVS